MSSFAEIQNAIPQLCLKQPFIFVTSAMQGDVNVFLPETFNIKIVRKIAMIFSRRINQSVTVFHDIHRQKYRLCPLSYHVMVELPTYGQFCFRCDASTEVDAEGRDKEETTAPTASESEPHIPRPRNKWILYRQAKSQEVAKRNPGITAAETSTIISQLWKDETPEVRAYWQALAEDEDRRHKAQYPGYKFTTKKKTT